MRCFVVLSLVIAGFAFAATDLGHINGEAIAPVVAGADEICSQPFDYATLTNGVGFAGANSWMMADDFTCADGGYIDLIEIWAIYGGGNASSINIELRSDGGAGPGAVVSSHISTSCTHENTGLSQWGYPLWYTQIDVENIDFAGATKYWLAMQTTGTPGPDYWLAANQTWADMCYFSDDNGASWRSSLSEWGVAYEQFMILTGTTSLARDTWGSIKVLF